MRNFLLTMLGIATLRPDCLLAEISVTVSTDQPTYIIGEPILITVTAVNETDEPVTLGFPSSGQSGYILDDAYATPTGGLAVITHATVPAHGTHDWSFYHPWGEHMLAVGAHEVVGEVRHMLPHLASSPVPFAIVSPEPVLGDVFIDFERFPDGTPVRLPNGSLTSRFSSVSYAAWGVTFRSDDRDPVTFNYHAPASIENVLADLYGGSPWNIVADFNMPVFAVSADVGADNGDSVAMSAFDAAGNLLGTVVSDVTTDFPDLIGPLNFTSQIPIASVEWTASDPLSTVRIDNLSLDVEAVPEPPSIALAVCALAMVLRHWQFRSQCVVHPMGPTTSGSTAQAEGLGTQRSQI
jgi:hypothetical protein